MAREQPPVAPQATTSRWLLVSWMVFGAMELMGVPCTAKPESPGAEVPK